MLLSYTNKATFRGRCIWPMSIFHGPTLGILIGALFGLGVLVVTKGCQNIQEPGRQAVFNCKYTCASMDYKYIEVRFTSEGTMCECSKESQVLRLAD